MKTKRYVLLSVMAAVLLSLLLSAANAADDRFKGMLTYNEGQYKVGSDFIAGEYVLLKTSGRSGCFIITTDANGRDLVSHAIFDTNSIVTVYNGEYLELQNCMAIDADDFYSSYTINTKQDGIMLKVGYDIMPGEYKLIAASGKSACYSIYNDSRQIDFVDADIFKNSAWVKVRDGQYLVLTSCHIN